MNDSKTSQMSPELEFAQLEINAREHAQAFVAKEIRVIVCSSNICFIVYAVVV